LGARALRALRLRRDFLGADSSPLEAADLRLGALGVRARREEERREADLEVDLVDDRRFEAFGARARRRRRTALRPADLRRLPFFGPFGVRARRADLRLEAERVVLLLADRGVLARRLLLLERLAFFALPAEASLRARFFLTPISLFLFSSISALYASLFLQ